MRVLRLRDFRLLWTGEAISGLGDQFALIALPWLALVLTGSGLALGSVLALMAVPRAALMAVGGAYTDRLSPRRVMLISNAVRLAAVEMSIDRKSTRLNSSHVRISYAVFCLKKKKQQSKS